MEKYSTKIEKNISLKEIEEKMKIELEKNKFGIVSNFSLSDIFKNKLGKDIGKYKIYGVCNPKYSYKIYLLNPILGGILPCKIVIFEENNKNYIGIINPSIQNDFIQNKEFISIINEVESILIKIIKNI